MESVAGSIVSVLDKLENLKNLKRYHRDRNNFLTPVQQKVFNSQTNITLLLCNLTAEEKQEHFPGMLENKPATPRQIGYPYPPRRIGLPCEDAVIPKPRLDEKHLRNCLKYRLKQAKKKYWDNEIQPVIDGIEVEAAPCWAYLRNSNLEGLYIEKSGFEKILSNPFIKITDTLAMDGLIKEFRKLLKVVEPEQGKQNPTAKDQPAEDTKPPSEAFQAYEISRRTGYTQQEIANIMSEEHNRPIGQWQVSRWIKTITEWYKAQGIETDSPPGPIGEINIDPNILDKGARTDGRTTGEPRHKSESNNDTYE